MLREPSKKWFEEFKHKYVDFYVRTMSCIVNEKSIRMQMAMQMGGADKVILDFKGGVLPLTYDLRLIYNYDKSEFVVKFGYTNPLMLKVFESLLGDTLGYTENSLKNFFSRSLVNTKFYTLTKEYKVK